MQTQRGEFKGTRRFRVLRCVGIGGMGEVYEAFDRGHHTRVALKLLTIRKPDALLRFKHEFRALRDLEHPNLVRFGELLEEDGCWFFTMEFVDGVDFYSYVRPGDREDEVPTRRLQRAPSNADAARSRGASLGYDEDRMRRALGQLASGLAALHAAGKVHRDIKPSNIRITRDGRLVLLDFGLVTDIDHPVHLTGVEEMVGTPAFVAPEQAALTEVGPEADWYSVGVLLFLCLTRRLPFEGSTMEILMRKQQDDPPPPSLLVAGLPDDLDALCNELLRRDPHARPGEREILRRLGVGSDLEIHLATGSSLHRSPFIGRAQELAELARLFERTREGHAVTAWIHGESGVGKSALVRHFTDAVTADRGAVVLSGSCYENELVPFKAVDGLIDDLIRYMKELPRVEAAALLPTRAAILTQVFPALRGVEVIAEAPALLDDVRDPQELRSRAFTAVRELLARLAERRPLILVVDDMQWSDGDSVVLLREIMRVPDPPALQLIFAVRTSPSGEDPPALIESAAVPGESHRVYVPRLDQDESRQLAAGVLEQLAIGDDDLLRAICDEAAGHPLFIHELARHAHAAGGHPGRLVLDEVLWQRIQGLGPEARAILEVIAIAAAPIGKRIAARALAMDFHEFSRRVSLLRLAHLLRQGNVAGGDSVEPYHDRIRVAALSRLGADARRDLHRRLAVALEGSRSGDLEALAVHWRDAGEPDRAAAYALQAAVQAAAMLAFDRAAHLYRVALELGLPDPADATRVRVLLGDALRNAGVGAEAAVAYQEAAAQSGSAADRLELQRRAAEELLLSGHFDDGMAALETVLGTIGMKFPSTPRRALISLLWNRARLRLRGFGFRERDISQVSAEELTRSDVSWSAAAGLSIIDNVRGADFQCRNLLRALRNGEPNRIVRAMAIEAGHSSISVPQGERRTRRLLEASQKLAVKLADPYALGLLKLVGAMAALLSGRWRRGSELSDEGEAILRARCAGVAWELDSAQLFGMDCLWFLGDLRELAQRLPRRIAEAKARGDLYATINFHGGAPALLAAVIEEDIDGARRQVTDAMARWSRRGVHIQHYRALFAHVHIDLYAGEGARAHQRVIEGWPALRQALLFRVELFRLIMTDMRGRTAIVMAGDPKAAALSSRRVLRGLARDAHLLAKGQMPWCLPASHVLRAGSAALRGDPAAEIEELREAAPGYDDADMPMHAMAVRRQLGLRLGGEEGARMVSEADAWLCAVGVRNPARVAAMIAPILAKP